MYDRRFSHLWETVGELEPSEVINREIELSSLILTWTNNPQHFIVERRQLLTDVILLPSNIITEYLTNNRRNDDCREKNLFERKVGKQVEPCLVSWMSYVEYVEMEPSDGFMTKLLNIWESSSMRVTLKQAGPGWAS